MSGNRGICAMSPLSNRGRGFSSRGFPVVTFQDAAEFASATDASLCLGNEVLVQNGVVTTHASMRSALLIMISPDREDIVQLSSAEANKVIQRFPADTRNIALDERIWMCDQLHVMETLSRKPSV